MSVSVKIEDRVGVVFMDDGKANAVNHELLDGLEKALKKVAGEADAMVLVGRPGRFSAGFDLSIMREATEADRDALVRRGGELLIKLYSHPQPVVAACSGHAIAMGVFLLSACDTRIGVDGDFKIGANETAIGMALPVFGLELPRARLDPRYLDRAVIQAEMFSPNDAVAAGYLDRVVAPEALLETAKETAGDLAELAGSAYAANKIGLRKPTLERMKAGL
ncbi:MAG: crotonase/enoyl-CoA hydratase family protein [Pseudomonadota bacterium]